MQKAFRFTLLCAAVAALAACGGGGGGGGGAAPAFLPGLIGGGGAGGGGGGGAADQRGTLLENPPKRTAIFTATQFEGLLNANGQTKALLQVTGKPKCGVDLRSMGYNTVGGKGEATTSSAAIMVPVGADAACTGARPVLLYAHGTSTRRDYDLAKWTDLDQPAQGEGALVAAMFAAQGYIVVAPNYAGYAGSTLPYHPYLNADQQGKDMVDALKAARASFSALGANASATLFVGGYSQGGHVALAAHRALQQGGQAVTASAPMSAPSALSLLSDYAFSGAPPLGGTVFFPLVTASAQKQFGDIYQTPDNLYEAQYATGIETLLPSTTPQADLVAQGKLPQLALFPEGAKPGPVDALSSLFYGKNNLLKGSYLAETAADIAANPCPGNAFPLTAAATQTTSPLDCKPANGLRRAAIANDLRNWMPQSPVFFCGGAQDPTVNFASTRATAGYFKARGMPAQALQVLDLEEKSSGGSDPYAAARAGFAQAKQALADGTEGSDAQKALAVTAAYHGSLVPTFCLASARGFFGAVAAN